MRRTFPSSPVHRLPWLPSSPAYNSLTQIFLKLIGGLGSLCDCSLIGADSNGLYCGAQIDPAVCRRCLGAQGAFAAVDIEAWRAQHHTLLRRAAFRIAPSQWAAATLARYFPDCPATVIEHGIHAGFAPRKTDARTVVLLPDDDVPTVAVLGAIGPDKGARRLERIGA